jgi:hypothetical protein
MTDSDFQSITEGMCLADGQLGPVEFEVVMRRQIKQVTQSKLALVGSARSAVDLEFMQFGALKMVLLEQVYSQFNFESMLWARGVWGSCTSSAMMLYEVKVTPHDQEVSDSRPPIFAAGTRN